MVEANFQAKCIPTWRLTGRALYLSFQALEESAYYTKINEIKNVKVEIKVLNDGSLALKIRNLANIYGYVWKARIGIAESG